MKRIFCLTLAAALLLSSCAAAPSPFAYQENIFRAVCTLDAGGGTYRVEITPGKALAVLEPEELCGVAFSLEGDNYTLSSGASTLDLPRTLAHLMAPIINAFSLPESEAKTSTSGDDTRVVKVSANGGDYEIKLASDGSPAQITYKGARGFVMREIEIN